MRRVSPFSLSSTEGTADRGARSDTMLGARWGGGWAWTRGGDEDRMPVLEVGTGVGYFRKSLLLTPDALLGAESGLLWRLGGTLGSPGSPGDDDSSSRGGSSCD